MLYEIRSQISTFSALTDFNASRYLQSSARVSGAAVICHRSDILIQFNPERDIHISGDPSKTLGNLQRQLSSRQQVCLKERLFDK